MSNSVLRPLLSDSYHGHLTTEFPAWKSHEQRQGVSFHPLNRSAPRPCLLFTRAGRPLHLRRSSEPTTLAKRCRKYATAGTFTPVCCCEESLPMQGMCTPYCARPARTCRRKNDRSFSRPRECFLGRLTSHPIAVLPSLSVSLNVSCSCIF